MKVVGLLHAKKNNQRLQGKHMMRVGSIPLVEHMMVAASESRLLDDVVVSSDDKDILELGSKYRFSLEEREPEYASDENTGYAAIQRSVERYENKHEEMWWIGLMGNCLILRQSLIDDVIDTALSNNVKRVLCVVPESHRFPSYCFKRSENGILDPWVGREDVSPSIHHDQPWYVDGIVYAWKDRIDALNPTYGFPVNRWDFVHVHDQFDMDLASWLYSRSPFLSSSWPETVGST